MKNLKLVFILLIILASLAAISFWRQAYKSPKPTEIIQNQNTKNVITQKINYAGKFPDEVLEVEFEAGESALAVLKRTKDIKIKQYSFGDLVESIGDLSNGTDNKSWIYYVNDAQATVGAGEYKLTSGDVIEWRFKAYEE